MAEIDLEALVGHLFIVDGRSMSTASPGALATSAPRKAARGRDRETFFSLLTLDNSNPRPASFYESLTGMAADTYYQVPGSATSALRTTLSQLGASVYNENQSADLPLVLGYTCAVLRSNEILLSQVGPVRCIFYNDGMIERLPTEEEAAGGMSALGQGPDPDVRYFRREVQAGDFIILADNSFDRLTNEVLQGAFALGDISEVLTGIASIINGSSTAQIIGFTGSSRVAPVSAPVAKRTPEPEPAVTIEPAAPTMTSSAEPVVAAEPVKRKERTPREPVDVQGGLRKASQSALRFFSRMAGAFKTIFEKTLPEDENQNPMEERWDFSLTTQIAIAFSVVVIAAVLTTAIYRFRGQTSKYAQLVREAQTEIEAAQVNPADQSVSRPHWEGALFLLDQAAEIRDPNQSILEMKTQAQAALDAYDAVTRVSPVLLREYDAGTTFADIVVNGLNVYLLNEVDDIIYRENIDEGSGGLTSREPFIVARQGDEIDGQYIDGFIDIAWMEEGAMPQRNVLAALTRNGVLVTYSPSWDVSAMALPGFEAWGDPRAIAVYDEDLYILDAGANEIWRYSAGMESYSSIPERYFTDEIPNLMDAIDMTIDANGNVFILHGNGMITKYFFGKREPFAYDGLPHPITRAAAFYLSVNLVDRSLMVADNGSGRIYSVSLVGGFQANFKDEADSLFDNVSGISSTELPSYVYITSGNKLYAFAR